MLAISGRLVPESMNAMICYCLFIGIGIGFYALLRRLLISVYANAVKDFSSLQDRYRDLFMGWRHYMLPVMADKKIPTLITGFTLFLSIFLSPQFLFVLFLLASLHLSFMLRGFFDIAWGLNHYWISIY